MSRTPSASTRTPHSNHRVQPYPPPNMQSFTPGPNQNQENMFNSGSSYGDMSNMSSAASNIGADVSSQGSFNIGVRGFSGLSHQGFRLEQSAFLVTKIVSREGLDDERRSHAHEYHAADSEDIKLTALYIKGLAINKKLDTILQCLGDNAKEISTICSLVNVVWALTPAQKILLQDLLQYYLIKSTTSYRNIISNAETYIASHRSKYHLDSYSRDDVVKKTIHMFLVKALVAVKSKYRKKLFKLVNAHVTLDTLSHTLVQEFHMLPRPNVISGGILSTVALQRHIAQPLASKKNKKGADTGFWDNLDTEMRKLVKQNGTDRKDPRWVEWEVNIIASDRTKFVEDREISSDEDVVEEDGDGDLPPDAE